MAHFSRVRGRPHFRIKIVGCGAISCLLLRPLVSYLGLDTQAGSEVSLIDGCGRKAGRLTDGVQGDFPSTVIRVNPEFLTEKNIADQIVEDDMVFVCVDNNATIRLILDHAVKLRSVTAVKAGCDWCEGMVQVQVRRESKKLTPPFANKSTQSTSILVRKILAVTFQTKPFHQLNNILRVLSPPA